MLKQIKDLFRALKAEMGLRPIHHQKEERYDSPLFISVLPYHVLHLIMTVLKQNDINHRWQKTSVTVDTQYKHYQNEYAKRQNSAYS